MAKDNEIYINLDELERIENRLNVLSKDVLARKFKIDVYNAQGATVDSVINVASQLSEIATTLAELIKKTEKSVQEARICSEEMETNISSLFQVK